MLAEAARNYLRAIDADPAAASEGDAAEIYSFTANALRMWALSRDRIDDLPWPSVITSRRGRDGLAVYGTRAGRAREQTRINELVRRYQAEYPPQGFDESDDDG